MRDIATNLGTTPSRHRARIALLVGLAALALIAAWYVMTPHRSGQSSNPGTAAQALPPVPVSIAEVTRRDFAIYLRAIGTVQAYNTVSIKSRVDGELQQVAFQEGQYVSAGDLLAQIDPRPFEAQLWQAEAARDRDMALLATAKQDFARSAQLVERGFTTRQTYDTQKNQIDQFAAAVRADEASIEAVKLQLTYARITSPLNGRTGVRLIDAGNMIHANDPVGLVTITQLQPISAMFSLPQDLLPEASAAMRTGPSLTVLASTQDGKRELGTGVLELIDNTADQTTGTIRLKARFPNENEALWPGQFVNIRLQLTIRNDALVVASPAVQRNQDGTYVWVVKPDNSVEVRPVRIETVVANEALVAGGLKPSERIVVDGHSRLRPGVKVVAKSATGATVAAARDPENNP
jgi:multidrug efflux system membrane fusion protein